MPKPHPEGWLAQGARFAAVGLVNTAVGLAVILGLQLLTPLGPYLANAGGYAAGLSVSFLLNRSWTFGAAGAGLDRQALRFALAFAAAYALNLGVLAGGIAAGLPPAAAQLPAICAYTGAFFVASRVWVFR